MTRLERICVFAGSNPGAQPQYTAAAASLGGAIAAQGIEVVYGGGNVGLMGTLADATLAAGGRVTGVIPSGLLERELAHQGLSNLEVVASMHERKARMAELADGFIALPGGIGTLEELFEVLTWAQLGIHRKPCGLLDICNYYAPLMRFLRHAVTERFVADEHREMLLVDSDGARLISRFAAYSAPQVEKWLDASET